MFFRAASFHYVSAVCIILFKQPCILDAHIALKQRTHSGRPSLLLGARDARGADAGFLKAGPTPAL